MWQHQQQNLPPQQAINYAALSNIPSDIHYLYKTLQSLLTAHNQQQINLAQSTLKLLSYHKQYIINLINIVLQTQVDPPIALSALTILKVTIRERWNKKEPMGISNEDKVAFISNLFENIERRSFDYKFCKIMKDIIGIIAYDVLASVQWVIQKVRTFQSPKTSLNILLGILTPLRNTYEKTIIHYYNSLIPSILPTLYAIISQGQTKLHLLYSQLEEKIEIEEYLSFKLSYEEHYYLVLKVMTKMSYLQVTNEIKEKILLDWVEIALLRLQQDEQQFDASQKNRDSLGEKGSNRFNYFHAKKWAFKLINHIFSHWISFQKINKPFAHIAKTFFHQHIHQIVQILTKQVSSPHPNKILIETFKTLYTLIHQQPIFFLQNYKAFLCLLQSHLLIPFMILKQQDIDLYKQNALFFIENESRVNEFFFHQSEEDARLFSIFIWMKIAKLQVESRCKKVQESVLGLSCDVLLNWVVSWGRDVQQLGCLLLVKLKGYWLLIGVKQQIVSMLDELVLNLLGGQDFILKIRGLEIIDEYSEFLSQKALVFVKDKLINSFALLQDTFEESELQKFITIKSLKAFQKILQHTQNPITSNILTSIIRLAFQVVLALDYQQIMETILAIIQLYKQRLVSGADFILTEMGRWFEIFVEKDKIYRQSNDGGEMVKNYDQIASGALQILMMFMQFIKDPQNASVRYEITRQMMTIMRYFWLNGVEYCQEYEESVMMLLSCYLYHHPDEPLQEMFWVYYNCILFKISNIHKKAIKQFQSLTNQHTQTYFFMANIINHKKPLQNLQIYVSILRNYIKFIPNHQPIRTYPQIAANLLNDLNPTELLYYMIYRFYILSQQVNNDLHNHSGKIFSNLMMIYLIQTKGKNLHESVYRRIFDIVKANIEVGMRFKELVRYNLQLFGVWMWAMEGAGWQMVLLCGDWCWWLMRLMGFKVVQGVYKKDSNVGLQAIQQIQERNRIILGFLTVIKCNAQHQSKHPLNLVLIKWVVKYLQLNIKHQQQHAHHQQQQQSPKQTHLGHSFPQKDQKDGEKVERKGGEEQEDEEMIHFDNDDQGDDDQQMQGDDYFQISEQTQHHYQPIMNTLHLLEYLLDILKFLRELNGKDWYQSEIIGQLNAQLIQMMQLGQFFIQKYEDLYELDDYFIHLQQGNQGTSL